MSTRSIAHCLTVAIAVLTWDVTGAGQTRPFEGHWVIVPSLGDAPLMGRHPSASPEDLLDGRLSIRMSGTSATVDVSAGSRLLSHSYGLDVSDAAPVCAEVKDGALVVRRVEVIQLPAGETTIQTVERYSLRADGTLLLERTTTAGGRSSSQRQFFQRRR